MNIPGRAWAYFGALLGGAVSIAANIAHSYVPPQGAPADWTPNSGAIVGAIFWPLALFLAIEILARVMWPDGRRWVALRWLGLVPVAVVAAVVSYRHMSGLLAFYGEDGLTVVIGPLAVDGLMVMATGALIATGRQRVTEPVAAAVTSAPSPVDVAATAPDTTEDSKADTAPDGGADTRPAPKRTPARTVRRTADRTPEATDVATKAVRILAKQPDIKQADLAAKLGVSERTLRRHMRAAVAAPLPDSLPDKTPDPAPVNGRQPQFTT